jgi:hypothetical protein
MPAKSSANNKLADNFLCIFFLSPLNFTQIQLGVDALLSLRNKVPYKKQANAPA